MIKHIKLLLKKLIYLLKLNIFVFQRDKLSHRYLNGIGIEIGALNRPLFVKRSAKVDYIDRISKEEAVSRFPEVKSDIIEPAIIGDGFSLKSISDNYYNFLIANHVLEHTPNPFQILINWLRVIRTKGFLYLVVPIAEKCFDNGREITTLDHLIGDHNNSNDNKKHYYEWITVSYPNILKSKGKTPPEYSHSEINLKIEEMSNKQEEIHFHTFDPGSFRKIMDYFSSDILQKINIIEYVINKDEIICLIQKT